MSFPIVVIEGDGIGPEVTREAVRVLDRAALLNQCPVRTVNYPMGGCAIDEFGTPLPKTTLDSAKSSMAVLLGAVGGPRWDNLPGDKRPEAGLLGLRSGMGVYANLRPALMFPQLAHACPLKSELVSGGIDLLVVRELTGGMYFGDRGISEDGTSAWDTERYSITEIDRLLARGFGAAMQRKKKLCVVDKANVLESSRLWRRRAQAMASQWQEVELSFMYVDNCAMQLVRNPGQFDVIATSNMFGDILSDEASMLTGSIGMLASASLGDHGPGLYEPIHGSAPDIAGQGIANPLAAILSVALLFRYSLDREDIAAAIEAAISRVLDRGLRCRDIARIDKSQSETIVGTGAMGNAVLEELERGAKK